MAVGIRQIKEKARENGTQEDQWIRMITSCETNTPPSWPAQFA